MSKIYPDGNGQYIVKGVDTLLGQPVEIRADLVVLAVGIEASKGSPQLAEKLRISYDSYGFFMESHPKLKPVETNTAGVFLAGVCQGTKDIPSSVSQGSAAAAKVLALCGLRQVHPLLPLRRHHGSGIPRREEGAGYRNRMSGLRCVYLHLSAGGHPAFARY